MHAFRDALAAVLKAESGKAERDGDDRDRDDRDREIP
jgi:hypothetical protein